MSQKNCTSCGVPLEDGDSQATLCDPCLLTMDSQDNLSATDGLAHDMTRPQDSPSVLPSHTPSHNNMADISNAPLICIAGCTYGNDARLSIVKCLWCRAPHHRKCVGGDVYVCDICSEMPKRISTMNQTIGHLSDMVHTLVENNIALQRTIDHQKGTIDSLEKHVKELVSVQMLQGSNSGVPTNKRNLIIGSSLLRDFDSSKLIQSEVTCIRGGKIQDVHNKLKSNTTTQYNSISIVVGGNDCNSTADAASVEDLAESYRSMVKDVKEHCSDVRIATIPPRNVGEVTSSRIDALNAALVEMCSEDGITLINNDETFKLRDGSINDGYYVQDGVHLNKAGSNRLAKNLKVNPKPEHAKDITQSHSYKDALVNKQGKTRGRHHNLNAKGLNQYGPKQGLTISHDHENPQTSGSGHARYHSSVHNVNGPNLDSSTTEAPWTQVSRRRTAANMNNRPQNHSDNIEYHHPTNACEFCHEENHRKDSCRHGRPIKCSICQRFGHKAKHHSQ